MKIHIEFEPADHACVSEIRFNAADTEEGVLHTITTIAYCVSRDYGVLVGDILSELNRTGGSEYVWENVPCDVLQKLVLELLGNVRITEAILDKVRSAKEAGDFNDRLEAELVKAELDKSVVAERN